VLSPQDLGLESPAAFHQDRPADPSARVGAPISLEALEREHIARVVAQSPSLEAAARTLEIDATTLQRKRKRFGLV
jgi:NtrC-family two-component system response regulator AlgB